MHILSLVLQMRKHASAHGYFSYGPGEAVASMQLMVYCSSTIIIPMYGRHMVYIHIYTSCDPADTVSRYRNINTRILRWVSFDFFLPTVRTWLFIIR